MGRDRPPVNLRSQNSSHLTSPYSQPFHDNEEGAAASLYFSSAPHRSFLIHPTHQRETSGQNNLTWLSTIHLFTLTQALLSHSLNPHLTFPTYLSLCLIHHHSQIHHTHHHHSSK